MLRHRGIFGLTIFLGLSSALVSTARAVDCNAYANEMVAIDQRARQMKCPAWTGSSNWNTHNAWCLKQPASKVNTALDTANAKFDGCAFTYGGLGGGYQPPKGPAKGDQSRVKICRGFADGTTKWRNLAIQRGCKVINLPHSEHFVKSAGEQFDWCMNTSDAEFRTRSDKALGFKALIEKECTAQLRRPFKL